MEMMVLQPEMYIAQVEVEVVAEQPGMHIEEVQVVAQQLAMHIAQVQE
jgi:hypothetical protein